MSEFLKTFQEIRRGELVMELGAHLTDLVMGVRETGRAGELVIKIKLAPASKGNIDTLLITDDVKVKRPTPERGATILFATKTNTLQRHDPRQPELSGLREVVALPRKESAV